MWWIQLFPQFRNLSFHLFQFIDKQRKHRCIINRLVLFRVFYANHQIREDFLNFSVLVQNFCGTRSCLCHLQFFNKTEYLATSPCNTLVNSLLLILAVTIVGLIADLTVQKVLILLPVLGFLSGDLQIFVIVSVIQFELICLSLTSMKEKSLEKQRKTQRSAFENHMVMKEVIGLVGIKEATLKGGVALFRRTLTKSRFAKLIVPKSKILV